MIFQNTIKCDGFNFSYSQDIKAKRISDNTDFLITNFITVVNGATTSDDYLSVFTMNYSDSPYIVSVSLTVTRPD